MSEVELTITTQESMENPHPFLSLKNISSIVFTQIKVADSKNNSLNLVQCV